MSQLDRKAPPSQFRLIQVDTFAKEDWIYKDYENKSEGRVDCARLGGPMLKAYLYDDEGKCIEQAGTY